MIKLSTLSLSVLALVAGTVAAEAQPKPGMTQDQTQQTPQSDEYRPYGHWGRMPRDGRGRWMLGAEGRGADMMGWGGGPAWGAMMGGGMMLGGGMMGPQMMVIMMDTDGNGAISLEEFEAIHARMFSVLDKNGDGELAPDEMAPGWGEPDEE